MKITAIDSATSTKDTLVYIVEPPVSQKIFDVFAQNYAQRPDNPGIKITFESGNLRVHHHVLPAGFADWLEQLLREAQGLIGHVDSFKEEKKKVEAQLKRESLEAAAKRSGLPLR